MKKVIAAVALTVFAAGTAMAADIILPAKNGNITFQHKAHVEKLKDCKLCHEKAPGSRIVAMSFCEPRSW